MTNWRDRVNEARSPARDDFPNEPPIQLIATPLLADALLGGNGKGGGRQKTMTLTVWFGEGRLKYSLNERDSNVVGWGVVMGNGDLVDEIERGFSEGTIDWKVKKDRK